MGFKSALDYNEERYGNLFTLRNDKDFADVIFLYQSVRDVLVADVHYIKSADYSGYAHCCGKGCPACAKGIRVQNKLFIPLYNITNRKIEFFDRSTRFENQLMTDVFDKYPNPSEYVFRITRNGEAGSQDTRYVIQAVAKNSSMPYAKILADNNAKMPDYYENVCKDLSPSALQDLLSGGQAPTEEYNYIPTPRASGYADSVPTNVPEFETPSISASVVVPDAIEEDLPPFNMPEPEPSPAQAVDTTEEVSDEPTF